MDYKKAFWAAVVLTILSFFYAWLTCGWLFNWVYSLEPVNVWVGEAAMTTKFFIIVNAGNLILYFIFALIFMRLQDCIPGNCRMCKGAVYGIIVWVLGVLPGMFSMYMFMTINKTVPIYWTLNGLVSLLIFGAVTGFICGNKVKGEKPCCFCS